MSNNTVIIGGKPFNSESNVDYNIIVLETSAKYARLTDWVHDKFIEREQVKTFKLFAKSKVHASKLINWLTYDTDDETFVWCMVNVFNLKHLLQFSLITLHESIAKFFYNTTMEWIQNNKDESDTMDFEEGKEQFGHNYGPNVTKLKNLKWKGYNSDKIKGYCVFEPIVRLKQLIEYPIAKFKDITFNDNIKFPTAPFKIPTKLNPSKTTIKKENKSSLTKKTNQTKVYIDFMERLQNTKDKIQSWDSYYLELIICIEKLTKKFL
jgi:hypothetical protein